MEPDDRLRSKVVALILDARPEEALDLLCDSYKVDRPRLGIGVVAGRNKGVAAVYVARRKEILAAKREYLYNPFVLIHEFYHHLRSTSGEHRGTERQADQFALSFLTAYRNTPEG